MMRSKKIGRSLGSLEGEEQEERHHEAEEPHGLGESKAQNSVGEELLLERRVASVALYERAKHSSDTRTRASGSYSGTPW